MKTEHLVARNHHAHPRAAQGLTAHRCCCEKRTKESNMNASFSGVSRDMDQGVYPSGTDGDRRRAVVQATARVDVPTASVWDVLHFCASLKLSTHNMLHRPLFNVPHPFPSFCSSPPPSTPTALPMTGIKRSPCATLHGILLFGHLAESTPLMSYEPKTWIDVSSEHTPINYSSRRNNFNTEYKDLTATQPSETPDIKDVGQNTLT